MNGYFLISRWSFLPLQSVELVFGFNSAAIICSFLNVWSTALTLKKKQPQKSKKETQESTKEKKLFGTPRFQFASHCYQQDNPPLEAALVLFTAHLPQKSHQPRRTSSRTWWQHVSQNAYSIFLSPKEPGTIHMYENSKSEAGWRAKN